LRSNFIYVMLKILVIIIGIGILIGFLFGFSVLRWMFKAIFGIPSSPRNSSSSQQKTKQSSKQKTPPSKKIISRDEGEYVDFEEVKDS